VGEGGGCSRREAAAQPAKICFCSRRRRASYPHPPPPPTPPTLCNSRYFLPSPPPQKKPVSFFYPSSYTLPTRSLRACYTNWTFVRSVSRCSFFYRGPKLHPTKITTLRPHPLTILCQTENIHQHPASIHFLHKDSIYRTAIFAPKSTPDAASL
jgi:hypothetical protein